MKIMGNLLANLIIFSSHVFNVHSVHNYKQLFIVSQLNSDINKGSVIKYNNITQLTDTHTLHTF